MSVTDQELNESIAVVNTGELLDKLRKYEDVKRKIDRKEIRVSHFHAGRIDGLIIKYRRLVNENTIYTC